MSVYYCDLSVHILMYANVYWYVEQHMSVSVHEQV